MATITHHRPVPLWRTTYRRALREILRFVLVVIAVPLIVPIFMLTVFARVYLTMLKTTTFGDQVTSYVQYIAPAALLMAMMLSATSAVSVAVERQTGFYDRMRISPAGPRVSNLSRRLADATKLAAFALILILVSRLSGAAIENWPLVLVLGTVLPASWGFAYGGLGFAACLWTGKPQISEAVLPFFFPLLFISSAFAPRSALPTWMSNLAAWNPLTYLSDAIRSAYVGDLDGGALARAVLSIVIVGAVAQVLIFVAEQRIARRA